MRFTAEQGRRYSADIKLGMFEQVVSNEDLKSRFTSVGLTDVQVTGSGRHRTAVGSWHGETQSVELPDQIASVHDVGAA